MNIKISKFNVYKIAFIMDFVFVIVLLGIFALVSLIALIRLDLYSFIGGLYLLIPLIWVIPMSLYTFKFMREINTKKEKNHLVFAVFCIFFTFFLSGVLLTLIESEIWNKISESKQEDNDEIDKQEV